MSSESSTNGEPPAGWNGFGELASIILPADSRAPGAAREVIAQFLPPLTTAGVLYDVQLLVSEVVTNSVRHAELDEHETVVLRIAVAAERVRLEVENPRTTGLVVRRDPKGSAEGGFGLELVQLLSTQWGVSRDGSTRVWFEMARA
jgi:anti-sigma regulatory factor (Ser/Thr protein kinase)